MKQYNEFSFDSYAFEPDSRKATFHYSFDNEVRFKETYTFDFDFSDYDKNVLDRALQNLFFMAGVSYYKMYLAPAISIKSGSLDEADAQFFAEVYQKGLGEFFYLNNLDPKTLIPFKPNTPSTSSSVKAVRRNGQLIGIGGGKDSIVTAEFLKDQPNVATWSLGHKNQLEPLIDKIGFLHFWVERSIDSKIGELNKQDAYNGHIPISAIFACVGTVVSVLTGQSDVVVSNEHSANEPNFTYRGAQINHQYSKSQEFEELYQSVLLRHFGESQRYYSFLRPLSELHIVEIFARKYIHKYLGIFSSCNRAFTQDSDKLFWCGACPKCAFTYLALAPFADDNTRYSLFQKNLLDDDSLEQTYRELLGIQGNKPLECVGEIKEAQSALKLALETGKYQKYNVIELNLPEDYDYKKLQPDSMPEEIRRLLTTQLG